MVSVDAGLPVDEITEQVLNSPYTRIPLWRDQPDNIVGVLHAKALLRAIRSNEGDLDEVMLGEIATEPWFIPDTTTLWDQLQAFRKRREHFALVVDEYGALMGIISLEDILEEIVGDIADEHDTHYSEINVLKNGEILVDGGTPIRDLNRQFNWKLSDDEAITIAGFIIDHAEIIPLPGQSFDLDGYTYEVMKRKRNQITKIKILPPRPDDD